MLGKKREKLFKHIEARCDMTGYEMADNLEIGRGTYYFLRNGKGDCDKISISKLREMRTAAGVSWKTLGRIIDTIFQED